jgi:hypothetical protein
MFAIAQGQLPLEPESPDARPALDPIDRYLWTLCIACWITPASLRPSIVHVLEDITKYRQGDPDPPSPVSAIEHPVPDPMTDQEASPQPTTSSGLDVITYRYNGGQVYVRRARDYEVRLHCLACVTRPC